MEGVYYMFFEFVNLIGFYTGVNREVILLFIVFNSFEVFWFFGKED